MKLHFDSNQEYQIDAIRAVTDIFEGQPLSGGDFEFSLTATGALLSENGVGNSLTLTEGQIWENVKRVQCRNGIGSPVVPYLADGTHKADGSITACGSDD